jgi:hypothetical protein
MKCIYQTTLVVKYVWLTYISYLYIMKNKIGLLILAFLFVGQNLVAGVGVKEQCYYDTYNFIHKECQKSDLIDYNKTLLQGNNDHQNIHQSALKLKIQKASSYGINGKNTLIINRHSRCEKSYQHSYESHFHRYLAAILFPFHYHW